MEPAQVDVSNLPGKVEKYGQACPAVHHGVAIYGPALSACPHRPVGISLMGDPLDEVARESVVDGNVIARAIGTEVVEHGSLGMCHGHVVEQSVATIGSRPEHHVEIDHVVHDGVVRPVVWLHLTGPAEDSTYEGIEQRCQRIGGGVDDVAVGGIVGNLVALAVGAEHQEAQVVVVGGTVCQVA